MGPTYPRESDIVVNQELAGGWTILGPRASQFALVVSVRVLSFWIDNRPVGHVREQEIDAVVEFFRVFNRVNSDEPLLIAFALHIPSLNRVASSKRYKGPTVYPPATKVEVLVNYQHAGSEVFCPNSRR